MPVMAATAWAGTAEPLSFSRYQVILDRSPFGGLPNGAGGAAPQPNFADSYTFVGVVEEQGHKLAIIQPKSTPRAEFKAEGETLGDVTVAKIEMAGENSKLILQRGLEKATLSYLPRGGASAASAAPPSMPAFMQRPTPAVPVPLARRRIPFRRGE